MKMKKIAAAALSAVMMFTISAANAAGVSRTQNMIDGWSYDGDEIRIMYNTGYLDTGDVKPVNKDGRVMLPFRAALEGMGATVDFDDDTKLVTAVKGDTSISFTLLSDTINIDKNGAKSEIKIDVPMYVDNGNTMVPIRFLSNAFGLQVGWEANVNTVMIFDIDAIVEDFKSSAPNLARLTELKANDYNDYNKGHDDIKFNIKMSGESPLDLNLDMTADSAIGENAVKMTADIKDFSFYAGGETVSAKDAAAEVIIADGIAYFKTDIISKMAKSVKSPALDAAALIAKPDEWLSLDFNEFIDASLLPDEMKGMFKTILENPAKANFNIEDAFAMYVPSGEDVTWSDMYSLAYILDRYEGIDNYIKIEEKDDGCSMNFEINMDNIFDGDDELSDGLSKDIIKELEDMLILDISADMDMDAEKASSNVHFVYGFDIIDGAELLMNLDVSEKTEKAENVMINIPEKSTDITKILIDGMV